MRIGCYVCKSNSKEDLTPNLFHILQKYQNRIDILISPEYSHIPKAEGLELSKTFPNSILIPGSYHVEEGNTMFNRAHIYYNGKLFATHDKHQLVGVKGYTDRENCMLNSTKTFSSGNNIGIAKIQNTLIGIEICRDVEHKILQKEIGHSLDYHIVISCGMPFLKEPNLAIKDSGLAVLVDGADPYSQTCPKKKAKGIWIRQSKTKDDYLAMYEE